MKLPTLFILTLALATPILGAQGNNAMMAAPATDAPVFDITGLGPSVLAFTDEAAALTLAAQGPTVYFFAARWCPTCRGTYADIKANFSRFPRGFSLVLVNYDTARALKTKYAVSYQHTFVQIDSQGRVVKKWNGSPGVADIVAQAKR